MRLGVAVCFLLLLILSCAQKEDNLFGSGERRGDLNKEINEASGLAASLNNPGLLWTHNDSGDTARVFLIDTTGRLVATVFLKNARNRDWEDIALGEGPQMGKSYLYVADIGDNRSIHPYKIIYRFEEPVIKTRQRDTTITLIDSIRFVMQDGVRDAEAIFVDPQTKDIYVFSKREKRIKLYRLIYPQSTTSIDTARIVLQMPHHNVVAADISLTGDEVLIKTYDSVFYWKKSENESIIVLLQKPPQHLPYLPEPQGEAITFDINGTGYYTVSEAAKGERPTLLFYKRKKED